MSLFCFLIGPIPGTANIFEQRNRKLGVTNCQRAALSKSAAASISYILFGSYSGCLCKCLKNVGKSEIDCPSPWMSDSTALKAFAVWDRTFIEHFYLRPAPENGICPGLVTFINFCALARLNFTDSLKCKSLQMGLAKATEIGQEKGKNVYIYALNANWIRCRVAGRTLHVAAKSKADILADILRLSHGWGWNWSCKKSEAAEWKL